ncbi:hypothetical protein QBC40DRAFT_272857 [Triangularia verruculosa]|uniref:Zn(2)-C6 fungal-type domain-containing protein n=1 Tax=Triangularia verruculosa TaxID=2587418 RepID=A0AAN7AZP8_9PEZI|nr:hypothetical protein QBC40DRAFT_272857 [Triangularia verruculosa]
MVYCGKASQGCQNCRTRRIKCDKVRPQCAQCIRVGKPCPGYRDQLSLMFRDESSKVIKRAHQQWGVPETSEQGEGSRSSPTSSTSSSSSSTSPTSTSTASPLTWRRRNLVSESPRSTSSVITFKRETPEVGYRVPKEISINAADRAIQFYIEHYVIGLPDEPKVGQELQGRRWVHSPATREIMAAVGLASLSNINGDKQLSTLSKQHYGRALQSISSSIMAKHVPEIDLDVILRTVIMMAMYEVVRGRDNQPAPGARTHIMGGAAILTSFLPFHPSQSEGLRGLLQMCFSMIASTQGAFQYTSPEPNIMIPSRPEPQTGEGGLPGPFQHWLSMGASMVTPTDRPSAELILPVKEFVKLSVYVRSQHFIDGQQATTDMIHAALALDAQFGAWEDRQDGAWTVTEEQVGNNFFPPEAVFEGRYHIYTDMYFARIWNHYRWARIMCSQLLLESVQRFPTSSSSLVSDQKLQQIQDCIVRLVRDTLISVPTHYRHPNLRPVHLEYLDKTQGGAVIGIAGIPTLLFEIKVAGVAPGILRHYRTWAMGVLETIWAKMGMYQARVLSNMLAKSVEPEGSPDRGSPIWIKEEGYP